ncbi:MAG: xanthine dehydrogenase molybdopterin binding subunit [Candidatus Symbiobacter sp.]|nr:xanthine dehydrogenase molybdopterin binding subunit [Candidatus Symbiobacter sp.]
MTPDMTPPDMTRDLDGRSLPHESARLHVMGAAHYTDDIPEIQGTLYAAMGVSSQAHAVIEAMNLEAVKSFPGVVAVLTAQDIAGENNHGSILHDDPILAKDLVQFIGQPIFAVIATSTDSARKAARLGDIKYQNLPPVLSPHDAHAQKSYVVPPMRLRRGDVAEKLAAAPHKLSGTFSVGGQEQFYLEGQISYALPRENQSLHVYCSTQHPTEMQMLIAHMLGWPQHRVTVEVRRMGGGFGGKETQSAQFACIAALAAHHTGRPVKLRLDRDDDMMITGKRHCFYYDYSVGFDETGLIQALKLEMILRAGYSADLSGPVATRAICHVDNAYYLSDVDLAAFCAKTNTQSNTAFRGFGGPQGAMAIEYIIDDIARHLGIDPLDVRHRNFYGKNAGAKNAGQGRDTTPYGQTVTDNIIHDLVERLQQSSDYRRRRVLINDYNKNSKFLRKGIALTPCKFGISFNVVHLNQAGALVHVYGDGTVLVNHGGTEMGQGLHTKICQIVAAELGITPDRVRVTATVTDKVPNTSATAASTGADLNGKAAQDAAAQIRGRLLPVAAAMLGCAESEVVFANNRVQGGGKSIGFNDLVAKAYMARVQLWSDGFYATPGLHWDAASMTGKPFFYFCYGAAVSEVTVDTLTGEWRLDRVDILHDVGRSLNPAIDRGQIEGAFIQGLGWLTTEQLVWNDKGRLMTHAPSTYKIPASHDCPPVFNVALYEADNAADTIGRSKAVGEPPILLSFSVFFAIRDALAGLAAGKGSSPPLNAPASCEEIFRVANGFKAV